MDSSPLFFATSGPTKRRTHYLCLLFSQYWTGVQKVNVLLTSPRNQFLDYHTWNRIEKLMPQLWNCSPQTLNTLQKTANLFPNLDFLPKSGFPKTLDLSMYFPWRPGSLGRALSVPAGRKDACTLLALQVNKPKNLFLKHVWRVWGVYGGTRGNHTSRSV